MTRTELRALCEAATPGPWMAGGYGEDDVYVRISQKDGWPGNPVCDVGANVSNKHGNSSFIVAARTEIPALLDELDAKDRRINELQERNESLMKLMLRLSQYCPHAAEHDSEPCPICGVQKLFYGIRAKWRDE